MFKGLLTLEAYEKCLSKGLCDKHFIDLEKEFSIEERHELQRKAFLYIRLRILDPLLFGRKFIFEKMEALLSKSDYFSSRSPDKEKIGGNFIDNILLLDSVVVFTLCQFCKICCCGCLFQSNQTIELGLDQESAFIQKLLNSKNVTENDIKHFNPVLQENFAGYDKSLIKFCYVVALLFVRNTTIKVRLKQALTELSSEIQKSSMESKRWLEIAKEAELRENYEESLEAITSALNYNSYCHRTLAARGTVYIQMKEYKKAQLDCYISALINPKHFVAYGNLCIILIHHKLFQDSLNLLKYAVKKCQFDKLKECPDFLELQKIVETETLVDNISQLRKIEELYRKLHENLTDSDMEINSKECPHLKKDVKSDSLENGFKNTFPEFEDVPDLEEDQDSEDDSEAPVPDLSDASKSESDDEADLVITNNNSSCLKESFVSETKPSDFKAKKSEMKSPETRRSETEMSKSPFKHQSYVPEEKKFELKVKKSEPEAEKSEPEAEKSEPEREKSEPEREKFEPEREKFEPEREKFEPEREKSEPEVKKSDIKSFNHLNLLKGTTSKQKLNELLKEGSEMLLDDCGYSAINQFVSAIEVIEAAGGNLNYDACEIVCIKYACGLAYYSSGGYEDLLKSLEIFKQIIESHTDVTFPAAHYGMGLAYQKLNRFKEALKYFENVNDILEKGIRFKAYPWPGLKIVINETKFNQLKTLVMCKIKECEMPPPPDAVCRYEECATQPPIYYSDPDFKGFLDLQCSDQCNLQYHAVCWKALKAAMNLTDKEFLEKACLTPDCNGIVIKVEIINKEGATDKVFRSVQEKKSIKPKKPKLTKRIEYKEEKRKRRQTRRESESEKQLDEIPHGVTEIDPSNRDARLNEDCGKEPPVIPLSVNAEPFIIIRKEKLSDENVLKTPAKSKELKKSKPVTISIKEFFKDSEGNDAYGFINSQSKEISTLPETDVSQNLPSEELDCDPLEIADFDAIKNNLYNYLEEFLTRNGPLSVRDVRLVRELETFPTEANVVIAKYGGISEFLKNDIEYRFGIVDDLFVCSRYDLADAYKLSRSSGVMGVDNADLLEEYGVIGLKGGPTLNPDAKEYKPCSSVASSSTNSFVSLIEDTPMEALKTEKASPLLSTISKLRQPLAVDDEEANNFLQDHSSAGKVTEECLAEKCIDGVKLYLSEELDSERAYIDTCIKPFKIVCSPNKSSKALQTETVEIKTESKGTMKIDEEFNDVQKRVEQLTVEKRDLEIQKTLIEAKLTSEMDAAAKYSKKTLVEIECLKKELEDSSLALQSLKNDYKNKEMTFEREYKILMESFKKSTELNDAQEKEINIWCSKNQSLQEKMKKMEGFIVDLQKENNSLKKSLDQQLEKYNSTVKNEESEKLQLMKRAKSAEVQFLQFRKEVFISKIDSKAKEARSRMKEIEQFLPMINPLYKKNLEILHTSISGYIKMLAEMRLDLQTRCDEQINAVNNGTLLESLVPVEAKELPDIPCFASNPSMNNPMAMYNNAQMMFAGTPGMEDRLNMNNPNSMASSAQSIPTSNTNMRPRTLNQVGKTPLGSNQVPGPILPPGSNQVPGPILPPGIQEPSPSAIDSVPVPVVTRETYNKTDPGTNPSSLSTFAVPPQTKIVKQKVTNATNPSSSLTNSGAIPKTPSPATSSSVLSNVGVSNKSCDSLSLELDYKGKQDSEKTASSISLASLQSAAKGSSAGKSCDKLLTKLKSKYPMFDGAQLMSYIKEFRKNRKGGLSGLTIESIISGVSSLIDSQNRPPPPVLPEVKSKVPQNKLVNKKLVEKETKPAPPQSSKAPCPWGPSKNGEKNSWSGSGLEEGCIICYEEMTPANAYKVDCGHCFHLKCIREWLNKKSDCPICRVHLLLPEDYPALS